MALYIKDFLRHRKFQVEIENNKSETREQENGIPQGAVISVTHFLIGINSIFNIKNKKLKRKVEKLVYADDIIIITIGTINSKLKKPLQSKINKIDLWARNIGFTIAPD